MSDPNESPDDPQSAAPPEETHPAKAAAAPRLRRTGTSLKNERMNNESALKTLVEDLLDVHAKKWPSLGVPEEAERILLDAQKIKSYAALGRQMRLARSALRDADWTLIRRRVDQIRAGFSLGVPEVTESTPAHIWSEQLLVQGDAGLARFCEKYEDADRKRLRQLVRGKAPRCL